MGIRGRKPKPTWLKVVSGNPGGRPLNLDEPQPEGDLATPPDWLSDAQKEIWRTAIADAPPGLLRRLDSSVFQIWVVAKSLHAEATAQVNKHGAVVLVGSNNVPQQSPWLPIINRQSQVMMKAASELGFSPTSRSRVKVSSATKRGNPFADLKRLDGNDD